MDLVDHTAFFLAERGFTKDAASYSNAILQEPAMELATFALRIHDAFFWSSGLNSEQALGQSAQILRQGCRSPCCHTTARLLCECMLHVSMATPWEACSRWVRPRPIGRGCARPGLVHSTPARVFPDPP